MICVNTRTTCARETGPVQAGRGRAMKILIGVDGSACTRRMPACVAAHDEWLGTKHQYTVIHGVLAVPHRVATSS